MLYRILYVLLGWFSLSACSDRNAEDFITGYWNAVTLEESEDRKEHQLPKGIHFEFDYPKYVFKGSVNETGKFYIKDDILHLHPNQENHIREIEIINLSTDSLYLRMVDTVGSRTVLFLREQ